MLPVVTVPSCPLPVLEALRGVFTAPTFATFTSLVTGLLGATGSRTVTGMWSAAGLAGQSHHARAHRFFSPLGPRFARVAGGPAGRGPFRLGRRR